MRLIEKAIGAGAHPVASAEHYAAMARKLKVFRTPTGFHDAYVAAPSRKAALEAWGADVDLFARGAAEEVSDPDFMGEALSRPGEVIRKLRGTKEEHLAALPDAAKGRVKAAGTADQPASRKRKTQFKAKPKPRPSREELDAAEQALDEAEHRYEAARRDLTNREAALRAERQAIEAEHERERKQLEKARRDLESEYKRAVDAWGSSQE